MAQGPVRATAPEARLPEQLGTVLLEPQRHLRVVGGLELKVDEQAFRPAASDRLRADLGAPDQIAAPKAELPGDPLRGKPAQGTKV
ncbi:MAG: hypothetical protein OXH09_03985 [Gammaproteobacteria bacterium]|nr:hypothetical protein [Gammaproteobacteria bacterium]